jgi:hypothetical protein
VSDPVADHLRSIDQLPLSGVLPPHYPTCLGCGPDAPQGYGLQVRTEGDGVAVATVFDDVLGFLLYAARVPGVTRHLAVEYLRPVLVGVPYALRGRLDSRDGRKLWVSATCTDPDGAVAATAKGLFLVVDVSHFSAATSGEGQAPVTP